MSKSDKLKQIRQYAYDKMLEWGLLKEGWKFVWDTKARRRYGQCRYHKKEIGIRFKTIISSTGIKQKVPECFNGTTNSTGRMDMSRFLQSNGTPYGGSIESQSADQNFSNSAAFGTKWQGK